MSRELSVNQPGTEPYETLNQDSPSKRSGLLSVFDDEVDPCDVYSQEQDLIEEKFRLQDNDLATKRTTSRVPRGPPFTLAFSGGGIRAAAFQSGVLWKLAEMGRLKDVEMLTAVSGGGYIAAAYQSHLMNAEEPSQGEDVDEWYREVVAQTIIQMQANQGGFVRDTEKETPDLGGGCLNSPSRRCDCCVLTFMVFFTMCINPILFLMFSVPVVETIEIFFGSGMRAAFCTSRAGSVMDVLYTWCPPFEFCLWLGLVLLVLTVIGSIAARLVKPLPRNDPDDPYQEVTTFYMVIHGISAYLTRVTMLLALTLLLIILTVVLIRFSWLLEVRIKGGNKPGELCNAYTGESGLNRYVSHCSTTHNGTQWFDDPSFYNVTFLPSSSTRDTPIIAFFRWLFADSIPDVAGVVATMFLFLFIGSCILLPFLPDLASFLIAIIGPLLIFLLLMELIKFRVYGPLTKAYLFGVFRYNGIGWTVFTAACSYTALLFVPFYQTMRAVMHRYYMRILKFNYMYAGEDEDRRDTLHDIKECKYAPLLLMTGTASDFVRPGDEGPHRNTTEISFSPLHMGSEKTGFVEMPQYFKLPTLAALTGAGGMDAIGLGLNDALMMRFWTETLNLTWGDYVLFEGHGFSCIRKVAKPMGQRGSCLNQRNCTWLCLRIPAILMWTIMFGLFAVGSTSAYYGRGDGTACQRARSFYRAGHIIFQLVFFFSFLWSLPCLSWISFSPILRLFHQMSGYYYTGNRPPPMLYITDGGAFDCTTLTQLIVRKKRRILLVLAAMDPNDELGVLRTAMDYCVYRKWCSFYDPKNPENDIKVYLDEFKHDKNMPFMHMGIKYGWGEENSDKGHLIIVKNRLRPECAPWKISPWVTEDDITGKPREELRFDFDFDEDDWEEFDEEELGGIGCCDYCHLRGCNQGAKWPQLTGANYLWLTPMLFNGLCRLGHRESEKPIEVITGKLPGA